MQVYLFMRLLQSSLLWPTEGIASSREQLASSVANEGSADYGKLRVFLPSVERTDGTRR